MFGGQVFNMLDSTYPVPRTKLARTALKAFFEFDHVTLKYLLSRAEHSKA